MFLQGRLFHLYLTLFILPCNGLWTGSPTNKIVNYRWLIGRYIQGRVDTDWSTVTYLVVILFAVANVETYKVNHYYLDESSVLNYFPTGMTNLKQITNLGLMVSPSFPLWTDTFSSHLFPGSDYSCLPFIACNSFIHIWK